ncbi:hypothetical protein NRS6094_00305 [Bacillus subtilis]|nr:hypothetical protein NRS6094_00305 [Bacillus subtilis]
MKQKSILFPCLLLAASVYAWLESGQAELFSGQDQWPVLLMLLGAAFVYQGKKEAVSFTKCEQILKFLCYIRKSFREKKHSY